MSATDVRTPTAPTPGSARPPAASGGPSWGGWSAAWRIARREAWRGRAARRRTAVVMLLVGLPVFFGGVLSGVVSGGSVTQGGTWPFGDDVQAVVEVTADVDYDGTDAADLAAAATSWAAVADALPAGDRLVADLRATARLTTADRQRLVTTHYLGDSTALGQVLTVTSGTLPSAAGEVAVTENTAEQLGIGLGDTVTFTVSATQDGVDALPAQAVPQARTVTVVGLYATGFEQTADSIGPWNGGHGVVTADPTLLPAATALETARGARNGWVVGTTPAPDLVQQLPDTTLHAPVDVVTAAYVTEGWSSPGQGLTASATDTAYDGTMQLFVAEVGFLVLLQIALIAAPAMAVGARRRELVVGLLGVNGASRGQAVRTVLMLGAVQGVPGAVLGSLLGGAVGYAGVALLPTGTYDAMTSPVPSVNWVDLVVLMLVGSLVAVAAAVSPARTAARLAPLAAVRGARPPAAPRARGVWLGALLLAGGTGCAVLASSVLNLDSLTRAVYALAGIVVAELGFILLLPRAVSLCARLASRGPVFLRMAARDADRHRLRTVPAVAATAAAVAACLAGTLVVGTVSRAAALYDPSLVGADQVVVEPTGTVADADAWTAAVGEVLAAEGTTLTDVSQMYSFTDATAPATVTTGSGTTTAVTTTVVGLVRPGSARCTTEPTASALTETAVLTHGWTMGNPQIAADDAKCQPAPQRLGKQVRSWGLVGTGTAGLRTIAGSVEPAAEQALAAGKAVTGDPLLIWPDGTVHVKVWAVTGDVEQTVDSLWFDDAVAVREIAVPAVLVDAQYGFEGVLPLATATEQGLTPAVAAVVGTATATDPTLLDRAYAFVAGADAVVDDDVVDALGSTRPGATVTAGGDRYAQLAEALLVLVALLVALFGAVSAVALAAAEGRHDMATLTAVGAAPRTRRAWAAMQALLVSGLGAVGGVVTGTLAGWVLVRCLMTSQEGGIDLTGHAGVPAWQGYSFAMPWHVVAVLLVGLPAAISLLFWAVTRSRPTLVRRQG